jgi:hypothetical protein
MRWYGPKSKYDLFSLRRFIGLVAKIGFLKAQQNEVLCMWGTGEVHSRFWWGDLRGKNHLKYLGVGWMIILKLISGSEMGQPGMD